MQKRSNTLPVLPPFNQTEVKPKRRCMSLDATLLYKLDINFNKDRPSFGIQDDSIIKLDFKQNDVYSLSGHEDNQSVSQKGSEAEDKQVILELQVDQQTSPLPSKETQRESAPEMDEKINLKPLENNPIAKEKSAQNKASEQPSISEPNLEKIKQALSKEEGSLHLNHDKQLDNNFVENEEGEKCDSRDSTYIFQNSIDLNNEDAEAGHTPSNVSKNKKPKKQKTKSSKTAPINKSISASNHAQTQKKEASSPKKGGAVDKSQVSLSINANINPEKGNITYANESSKGHNIARELNSNMSNISHTKLGGGVLLRPDKDIRQAEDQILEINVLGGESFTEGEKSRQGSQTSREIYCGDEEINEDIPQVDPEENEMNQKKSFYDKVRRVFGLGQDEIDSKRVHSDSSLEESQYGIWDKIKVMVIDEPRSVLAHSALRPHRQKPKECSICTNMYTIGFKMKKCGHQFCHKCAAQYLEEKILNNQIKDIPCMQSGCEEKFNESDIKETISFPVFQKFEKFKKNHEVNGDPCLKWCPKPDCEKFVKMSLEDQEKRNGQIKCECGTEICFKCGNLWHPNQTCEQILKDQFQKYQKIKEVQLCPGCKSPTEKEDGCNHMSCTVCGYQWCWICKGEYTPNHFSKLNVFGCPGMMNDSSASKSKRCINKMKSLLRGLLLLIFSPLIIFVAAAITPAALYSDVQRRAKVRKNGTKQQNSCSLLKYILVLLLGIALSPLTAAVLMVLLIVPGSCIYIKLICTKSSRRRRQRNIEFRARAQQQNQTNQARPVEAAEQNIG